MYKPFNGIHFMGLSLWVLQLQRGALLHLHLILHPQPCFFPSPRPSTPPPYTHTHTHTHTPKNTFSLCLSSFDWSLIRRPLLSSALPPILHLSISLSVVSLWGEPGSFNGSTGEVGLGFAVRCVCMCGEEWGVCARSASYPQDYDKVLFQGLKLFNE